MKKKRESFEDWVARAYRELGFNREWDRQKQTKPLINKHPRENPSTLGEQAAVDFMRRQGGMHGGVLGRLWQPANFADSKARVRYVISRQVVNAAKQEESV
jgi:hypothetical protein